MAKHGTECLAILLKRCDLPHCCIERRLAHFRRIDDRQSRLLLERAHPAIPELRLVVKRVQDRWGVTLADPAVNADGNGSTVCKRTRGIVTGSTGDASISRQPPIEEQA